MKFEAVSTFNCGGLALYGRRMMESFHRNWPDTIGLTVYSEGWRESSGSCRTTDLLQASPWLAAFKARHHGQTFKDFRWDAVRFAHKAAAVCHAARRAEADALIWLDGDIFTHSPLALADIEDLAPKGDEWIAWLDRDRMYPECGFYMLNCRHPRHLEMIAAFEAMYREDLLFTLREWHDSYVLQQVVTQAGVGAKSLSGPGRNTSHPLVNGPLGAWFDHLKGNRKREGRSPARDLRIARTEGYWQ